MVNSRDKGKRGELEARDMVRLQWDCPDCVRSAQVSGKFSSDLMYGPEGLHLEVKRYAKIAACEFMEQAVRDARPGEIPVVLMRQNEGEWLLVVRFADSPGFASLLHEHLKATREGELHRPPAV